MQPSLVIATDICLCLTLIAVAIGFAGRLASGQLALVVGASATAICWLLHQLTTPEPRYSWTGSEYLWCGGILIAIAQIVPIPSQILSAISPQIKTILPLWFGAEDIELFSVGWHQLSLAPWETTSALATFVSYALLFLVMSQRIRTIEDVESSLCYASLATVAMMVFAQLQYFTSNGKFFWVYENPFVTTNSYPLGSFTNRNHLAQFLALGTPPLIWWLLRRLQQQERDRAENRGMPAAIHAITVTLLVASLAGIGLTNLMILSRGGLLALGIASVVTIALLCRLRLASLNFGIAVLVIGATFGGLSSFGNYEAIMGNRLEGHTGRSEIWLANLKVAADFPILGTGIGTHCDAYQLKIEAGTPDGIEYTHAESGYLQIASESGIAGLIVAILFIATGFWWSLGALQNPNTDASSAAAAILAGLLANVVHAAFDFFWYTPSCMLLLALQLAAAARLYRSTRQSFGFKAISVRVPRLVTATAMCGVAGVAIWMFDIKYPAALAESHRFEAGRIANVDVKDMTEEENAAAIQLRLKETILAGKCEPRDAKLQEAAASALIQLFDIRQQQSENPMSADMLRDTVKVSQFPTAEAAQEWLNRAVGPNLKLLRLADRSLKRSLANGPLRAKSYVMLTDLRFLDDIRHPEFTRSCLKQSMTLRPNDPDTLFLVGMSELQEGDMQRALTCWRPAFKYSLRNQEKIAAVLAGQMTPEFFDKEFQPTWKGLNVIGKAFAKAGRLDDAHIVKSRYVTEGMKLAKSTTSEEELESTLVAIRNTCHELGDLPAAIDALSYAVERMPHNYSCRYMLGLDLMRDHRAADAAEHLQWCVDRRPNDEALRKTASVAIIERLKRSPTSVQHEHDIEQTSFRR